MAVQNSLIVVLAVIGRMFARCREQLKILKPVVVLYTIDVVNDFLWFKHSPKMFCHYEAVFQDPATRSLRHWMTWSPYDHVAAAGHLSFPLKRSRELRPMFGRLRLSTLTGADVGPVFGRIFLPLPARAKSRSMFGRLDPGVVPMNETLGLPFDPPRSLRAVAGDRRGLAAAAFARAVRCHDRNVPTRAA